MEKSKFVREYVSEVSSTLGEKSNCNSIDCCASIIVDIIFHNKNCSIPPFKTMIQTKETNEEHYLENHSISSIQLIGG
jgi:hypothetical protein